MIDEPSMTSGVLVLFLISILLGVCRQTMLHYMYYKRRASHRAAQVDCDRQHSIMMAMGVGMNCFDLFSYSPFSAFQFAA